MHRDRDFRFYLVVGALVVALFLVVMAKASRADVATKPETLPVSCDMIRQYAAAFTTEQIVEQAFKAGANPDQIRQIKACLRRKDQSK